MVELGDPTRMYSETHDAMYNSVTDTWLDSKCDDTECEYCQDRPEFPSQVKPYETNIPTNS